MRRWQSGAACLGCRVLLLLLSRGRLALALAFGFGSVGLGEGVDKYLGVQDAQILWPVAGNGDAKPGEGGTISRNASATVLDWEGTM